MTFESIRMSDDGVLYAHAKGHASEVVTAFHSLAELALSGRGPWRITSLHGEITDDVQLDSAMSWNCMARNK